MIHFLLTFGPTLALFFSSYAILITSLIHSSMSHMFTHYRIWCSELIGLLKRLKRDFKEEKTFLALIFDPTTFRLHCFSYSLPIVVEGLLPCHQLGPLLVTGALGYSSSCRQVAPTTPRAFPESAHPIDKSSYSWTNNGPG